MDVLSTLKLTCSLCQEHSAHKKPKKARKRSHQNPMEQQEGDIKQAKKVKKSNGGSGKVRAGASIFIITAGGALVIRCFGCAEAISLE